MGWLKVSDAAATHPIVLRPFALPELYDGRIINEVFGWVMRCATQSAAHDKDYIIEIGVARQMAGEGRYDTLVATAIACGYISQVEIAEQEDGPALAAFRLVEEDDLFHMILKAEKAWNNGRQRNNRNPALVGPVRARDGDACRYCGIAVKFGTNDRRSPRVGTIDHVHPGQEAASIDDLVVACHGCNSARKKDPDGKWTLLPVPTVKIISPFTALWLTETCGIPTEPTYKTPAQLAKLVRRAEASVSTHHKPSPGPATQAGATANDWDASGPPPEWATAGSDTASTVTSTPGPATPAGATAEAPGASGTAIAGATASRTSNTKPKRHKGSKPPEPRSKPDQDQICDPQGGGSEYVGSGRDGQGRARSGGGAEPPARTQPRSQRRSRPRNRRKRS